MAQVKKVEKMIEEALEVHSSSELEESRKGRLERENRMLIAELSKVTSANARSACGLPSRHRLAEKARLTSRPRWDGAQALVASMAQRGR